MTGLTIGKLREILEKLDPTFDTRPVVIDLDGYGDDRVVLYEDTYTPTNENESDYWFALTFRVNPEAPVLDTREW